MSTETPLDLDAAQADLDYASNGAHADAPYNPYLNTAYIVAAALLAEVRQLRADQRESNELRERMSRLLTDTAAALKGEPPPLVWHDWSDLPAVAAAARAELERQRPVLEAAQVRAQVLRDLRQFGSGSEDWNDRDRASDKQILATVDEYVAGVPATKER